MKSQNLWHKLCHNILKLDVERLICFGYKSDYPQRQLIAVYVGYSVIGTLLLLLPFSSKDNISIVDHLFTAVSAISTTGLTTVNVATDYTFFGQLVILLLIQMGCLGYMTLSSYVMLRLTRRFGTQKAKLFNAQFSFPDTIDSESMLRNIVNFTLVFEIVGILLLYPYFLINDIEQPLWSAIFHTVSAFGTAGFSIYPDNMMQFQTDVYVNIVIMILCYAGAMGFIMMTDIYRNITSRKHKITFTSKVIIVITTILTLWSTLHLFFFEHSLQHFSIGDRLMVSLFQSMSAMTTAGYNTVDIGLMVPISLVVLSFAMYIGASPSGTGGGLKSTTLSAIYAYTKSKLGMQKQVSLRGNIIPDYRVETAITTIFFYTFILLIGIYTIELFEPDNSRFLNIVFEAASALATTGLSSGAISSVTVMSKLVLIILMFIGRVGVLTFGNAVLMNKKYHNPQKEEDMAV